MNQTQWQEKEKYYTEKLKVIVIPPDINPSQVINLRSEIDALFAEARLDLARVKRTYDRVKRDSKNYEKSVGLELKKLAIDPNVPKEQKPSNDKEREAWIVDYIKKNPLPGYNVDVYTALNIAEERYIFMDAVIDILKEKADSLITDVACLKLDADLTANRTGRGAENIMTQAGRPVPSLLDNVSIPNVAPPPPPTPAEG